jgi:hypothetical protein
VPSVAVPAFYAVHPGNAHGKASFAVCCDVVHGKGSFAVRLLLCRVQYLLFHYFFIFISFFLLLIFIFQLVLYFFDSLLVLLNTMCIYPPFCNTTSSSPLPKYIRVSEQTLARRGLPPSIFQSVIACVATEW